MNTLNVVYDLRVLPATYDFPYFLAVADARRRVETSATTLSVWIVTGPSKRPKEWDWDIAISDGQVCELTRSRLNRVIFPAAFLFESVVSVNVIDACAVSSLGLEVFHPINYNYENPAVGVYHKGWYTLEYASKVDMRAVRNRIEQLDAAKRYLNLSIGSDSPVVITVRNNIYSHDQTRNSRFELLIEIIIFLKNRGFTVAVIPDTSLSGVDVSGLREHLIIAPALDLTLRSAVYECASFCLFEPTGPLVIAQLNPRVRFIAYGIAWSQKFSASYQLERGYRRDINFIAPGCNAQQYLWSSLELDFLGQWIDGLGVVKNDR